MIIIKTLTVGALQSNCYIVYNSLSKHAVIIDPGNDTEIILDFITELGLSVDYLIITHAHFDHVGAVDAICNRLNTSLIMNKEDEILLGNPDYNLSSRFPGKRICINCKNIKYVKDDVLNIIDHTFKFIHTPGHTKGSMCVIVENSIFTGDTLFKLSVGNEFPPFGNFKLEIKSIKEKLFSLKGDYVCFPGHGEQTTLDYERKFNPYINSYENQINRS